MNLTEGDDRLLWPLLITSHTKTWLAHDTITISYDVFVVFACTLLHCELRDYSLGQIAFAVFSSILCYRTAALSHKRC